MFDIASRVNERESAVMVFRGNGVIERVIVWVGLSGSVALGFVLILFWSESCAKPSVRTDGLCCDPMLLLL